MPSEPQESPSWKERANLLISLRVPNQYGYLITPELIEQGAELLRSGRSFEVQLNLERLGGGFGAAMAESIGDLPGVTSQGISAEGLISLVAKAA